MMQHPSARVTINLYGTEVHAIIACVLYHHIYLFGLFRNWHVPEIQFDP